MVSCLFSGIGYEGVPGDVSVPGPNSRLEIECGKFSFAVVTSKENENAPHKGSPACAIDDGGADHSSSTLECGEDELMIGFNMAKKDYRGTSMPCDKECWHVKLICRKVGELFSFKAVNDSCRLLIKVAWLFVISMPKVMYSHFSIVRTLYST